MRQIMLAPCVQLRGKLSAKQLRTFRCPKIHILSKLFWKNVDFHVRLKNFKSSPLDWFKDKNMLFES